MTDQELADKIVALDLGFKIEDGYYMVRDNYHDPESFVRDWRVAGAMLQRVAGMYSTGFDSILDWSLIGLHGCKPRALNEVCVEALT